MLVGLAAARNVMTLLKFILDSPMPKALDAPEALHSAALKMTKS